MMVTCGQCGQIHDDARQWTVCPHNPLDVDPQAEYCQKHDLFNCWLAHGPVASDK